MRAHRQQVNVGLLIHGLGLGGAQQIIKMLVTRADGERFRFVVYCCLDGLVREEVERAGTTVRILSRHLPKLDPTWVVKLSRAMRDDDIDVVHTHLFGDSLHGYLAAGRRPVVMTLHAKPDILPALQRWGYRWLLGRTARVVACSQSTHRAYVEAGWPGADTYQTITNGIEDRGTSASAADPRTRRALRRELGLEPDATVFGAVGRLSEEKGYAYLIRAFARLVRSGASGVQLVFIGGGTLEGQLRALAQAEDVADRVVFAGYRSNVRELLEAIDTIVFSSFSEGLSIALLEAMAAARPVVGTEVAGILEAVRPGQEALIVPVRSVEGLAGALGRLAGDRELRSRLGGSARRRFLEKFTAERMVRDYEATYNEVHARSAGRQ